MNFKQDTIQCIINEFSYLGIAYTSTGNLDSDLLNLFTIQRKFIYPTPRRVEISKELDGQIKKECKHHSEILVLKENFESGQDVNGHQSRNVFNYHVHDKLIYDWNIYHLHLSLDRDDSYFRKRTKKVLFAYVDKDKVLFLDVFKHPPNDVFADKKLLEIIDNNWSNILLEVNGVQGLTHNATQKERFKMRKHNINEGILEVNGKFIFSPGFGQTASGHSAQEVMKLNNYYKWMEINEKAILKCKEEVDELFMKNHDLKEKPQYKIVFTNEGPQIWDEISQKCLVEYNKGIRLNNPNQ